MISKIKKQISGKLKSVLTSWNSLSKKRKIFILSFVFVIVFVFATPLLASANIIAAGIAKVLLGLLRAVAGIFAWIIKIEMSLFITLVQWNKFTHGITAVEEGWKITRDVCNMFFILMLLVIAFSTILNYEAYSYKKWLSKIIVTAVLINFSKTIVGLMIDFSQVIMLTFVNAFKDIAMGNLINGLHLNSVFEVSYSEISAVAGNDEYAVALNLVVIAALAVAMLAILSAILAMFIVMIVWRIVYLWVLVILSPLAFFLQGTPFSGRASKWWTELGRQLTTGPVLAFFLYLALLTIQRSGQDNIFKIEESKNLEVNTTSLTETPTGVDTQAQADANVAKGIGNMNNIFDFVIVIALLMTAMKITQESGVAGSNIAGKITSKMGNYVKRGAKGIGRGVGRKVGGFAQRNVVNPLNEKISKTPLGQHIPGTYANKLRKERIDEDRKTRVRERETAVAGNAASKFNKSNLGKVLYGKTGASKRDREKNERTPFGWSKMYGKAMLGNGRLGKLAAHKDNADQIDKSMKDVDKMKDIKDSQKELLDDAQKRRDLGIKGGPEETQKLENHRAGIDNHIKRNEQAVSQAREQLDGAKTPEEKALAQANLDKAEKRLSGYKDAAARADEKIKLSKSAPLSKEQLATERESLGKEKQDALDTLAGDHTISEEQRQVKKQAIEKDFENKGRALSKRQSIPDQITEERESLGREKQKMLDIIDNDKSIYGQKEKRERKQKVEEDFQKREGALNNLEGSMTSGMAAQEKIAQDKENLESKRVKDIEDTKNLKLSDEGKQARIKRIEDNFKADNNRLNNESANITNEGKKALDADKESLDQHKKNLGTQKGIEEGKIASGTLENRESSASIASPEQMKAAESRYGHIIGATGETQSTALTGALDEAAKEASSGKTPNLAPIQFIMNQAAKDGNLEAILKASGAQQSGAGLMEFLRVQMLAERGLLKGTNAQILEQLAKIVNGVSKEAGGSNLKYAKMANMGIDGKMASNVALNEGADLHSKTYNANNWNAQKQNMIIDVIYSGKETLELFRSQKSEFYEVGGEPNDVAINLLKKHEGNLVRLLQDGKAPFTPKDLGVLMKENIQNSLKENVPDLFKEISSRFHHKK